MKIEEIRSSFTVYLVGSEMGRLEGISDSLSLAGYMVANFSELSAAISEVYSNPPHFVLFDSKETKFALKKAISQISAQLPESHIYLVTPAAEREKVAPMLDTGVYDLILTPLATQTELVRKLDRAAERDYFMYMNEQLAEVQVQAQAPQDAHSVPPLPSESPSSAGSVSEAAAAPQQVSELFKASSGDEVMSAFLKQASSLLGGCPALFLKYIGTRRVLIVAQTEGLDGHDLNGVGVNFNELSSGFRTSQLREPKQIPEIAALVKEVFGVTDFIPATVEALGEIQGVVIFLCSQPTEQVAHELKEWNFLLNKSLSLIESEKRLHVMCVKDPATDLLNRQNFMNRVRDEVSRARRTSLPVSLALIAVDQYGQIVSQAGQEEAQTVLKMAARIFEKHSRVNDVIGRTGADEFGIILSHTHKHGALIKVERLRRIIESADFSRVMKAFPNITISIGVAEYPSMVRDAEEFMQAADEALFQIRRQGNKTCVAKPPEGFVADFIVPSAKGT